MNKNLITTLGLLLLLLSVTAVTLLVSNNTAVESKAEIRYAVTSTAIVNNKAVVKVLAGIFAGRNVDPFNYVRLVDENNLPYYPLNGYKKPSLGKGDSMELTFEFVYPDTINNKIELRNNQGAITSIDLTFPELINQDVVNIIAK